MKDYKAIPAGISFKAFEDRHPEWRASNEVFVFFRDHPAVFRKSVLIQREQIFGTCAIHAPVVLQHYLLAIHHRGAAPTLDIPSWMRKKASGAHYASCVQAAALFVRTPQPNIPFPDLSNAVFSVSAIDGTGVSGIGAPTMTN